MKRLSALFIALVLFAVPVMAEAMSPLDYTDDVLQDGSLIYYFPELSLTLPADWNGKVMALREGDLTSFYQKASYQKYQEEGINGGGFLFALGTSADGSFSTLPSFDYLGFSNDTSLNYYLEYPTDYPAYMEDDIRAEYDAMYGELDFVKTNAAFYDRIDVNSDSSEGTGQDVAEPDSTEETGQESGVSLQRARYHFEHSALPRYFYEDPENMMSVLEEAGTFRLWQSLADENGVDYPYTAGDYKENLYTAEDGTEILQVVMPKPEDITLCYRVYLVSNPDTGDAGYYTIEYDNFLEEAALTCGWTKDLDHVNYGGAAILDPESADYEEALLAEAQQIAELFGASGSLKPEEGTDVPDDIDTTEPDPGLAEISCPEMGFTTMADPAYSWDYQDGTGITIYTEEEGRIPYVIVWQGEDLIVEAYEYICEQYTPHIMNQYGDDLVSYEEYEAYDVGGKQLPAGIYTYKLQGYLIDLIRVYDSTGDRTVAYTAKYIQDEGEATLSALDDAIRYFKAG